MDQREAATAAATAYEDRLADELAGWAAAHGPDTFVVWPSGEDLEGQVERLAAVRQALKGSTP